MHRRLLFSCLLSLLIVSAVSAAEVRPRIRAITAFIEVDKDNYAAKIDETTKFLAAAKAAMNGAGFEGAGGRITTQPFPVYTKGMKQADAKALIAKMTAAATRASVRFNIGPAMINDTDDTAPVALLTDVLTDISVNASLIVADEKGIHWHAVQQASKLIKEVSMRSPHGDGTFNFAAAAMMKPYGPFYPASFHFGKGHAFAIAVEGANVVKDVFTKYHDPKEAEQHLSEAFNKFTKDLEAVAMKVAAQSGWTYEGIDATPAPLGDVTIGGAIEAFTGGPFGTAGTMTASGIITRAVQSTAVKRTGYSGLMIPVMEDNVLAKRWTEGTFSIDSILAYSAVCAGGVDTVPLPGDVSEEQIGRIIGDVAWLAYKWNKPLGARLQPSPGRKVGQMTDFTNSSMVNTTIQPMQGSKK